MTSILKEEIQELDNFEKNISIAQLNVNNANLFLELERSRFENFKLSLFRKYKIEDDMYIDKKDRKFKPISEIKE